jgi:butyrate kinase
MVTDVSQGLGGFKLDMKAYRILTLNPSRTFTKVGVFQNEHLLFEKKLCHNHQDFSKYNDVVNQCRFRKKAVLHALDHEGINLSKFDAVSGFGGIVRPIEEGTYEVNDLMLKDLQEGSAGAHISNLGGILAYEIASGLNIPSFIVNPTTLDELEHQTYLLNLPAIERKSVSHVWNQKAAAKRAAREMNKSYKELNLIVVHMNEAVTIGVHKQGKVVDVNNKLDGDEPLSLECAETVLTEDVTPLVSKGRVAGYAGPTHSQEIQTLAGKGRDRTLAVWEGAAYQIAKEIGAASTVVFGRADAIVLTGSFVHAKSLVQLIIDRVNWIADVAVYPVETELQLLAEDVLRVLKGEEQAKIYPA